MPQDRRLVPRPEGRERRQRPRPGSSKLLKHLLPALLLLAVATGLLFKGDGGPEPVPYVAPPPAVGASDAPSWRAAARRVEEPRGEPMGRAASGVLIRTEMRHYADTRRFLAVQVASWREQGYPLPHDDAELAELIRREEFVPVPVVGDHHILYGVGANASDDPIFHYEVETGQRIPLFARYDLYEDVALGWQAEIAALQAEALARTQEMNGVPRKERRRRAALAAAARKARESAAAIERRRTLVASFYDDEEKRRRLTGEWAALHAQAAAFPDRPYKLTVPRDRRVLRARLLSHIRPEARDVMMEIAEAYHAQFDRPLAFTSLARTQEYQVALGETNPNATRIAAPPHTTGLAFDVFYRYMTAAEQNFVMNLVSRMEREGRLEALRENRDHIHIFAFASGRRPPEHLIAEALGDVRPVRSATVLAAPGNTRRTSLTGRPTAGGRKATVRKPAARSKTATARKRPAPRKASAPRKRS